MSQRLSLASVVLLFAVSGISAAQSLQTLTNQPPDSCLLAFLMTDGTVLCQGGLQSDWWKLTPDITGSYVNGTWTQASSLKYAPYAMAEAVLADGRVVICGGEYLVNAFKLTNRTAIYDAVADTWTDISPPAGWNYIGDSPSVVLPDGGFMVGDKLNKDIAILDPRTLKWTEFLGTGKADFNAEEGWTLLPDGSVLTEDVKGSPNSELFVQSTRTWSTAGSTIVDLAQHDPPTCLPYGPHNKLCYHPPGEIGPAMLRPDGTVFATGAISGAVAHTAIYDTKTGTWTVGPDIPNGSLGDSTAVLETNGNVLFDVSDPSGRSASYEWDGKNLNPTPFSALLPLLVLPTGQVLVFDENGYQDVYTPAGTHQPTWAPRIVSAPSSVVRGYTYKVTGTQFNGLSQGQAFGDELEAATNYPLVRVTNNATGHIFYARTHDHSTMGVATGSLPVSTKFDVPASMETGASTLEVVANGIPSAPVRTTVK